MGLPDLPPTVQCSRFDCGLRRFACPTSTMAGLSLPLAPSWLFDCSLLERKRIGMEAMLWSNGHHPCSLLYRHGGMGNICSAKVQQVCFSHLAKIDQIAQT